MSDHVKKTLSDVAGQIESLEAELLEKKRFANYLSNMDGGGDVYSEIAGPKSTAGKTPTRGDEFVGMKAQTAFRAVLDMGGEPLDINQIYELLIKGGYEFSAKNETNSKNSLRVTLSKRSNVFRKLTNGKYGLQDWYPNEKPQQRKPEGSKPKSETVSMAEDDDRDGLDAMNEEWGSEPEASKEATIDDLL